MADPRRVHATLSVVICTRNRGTTLDRCLSRIAALDHPEHAEILVVDNGSTDSTKAVVDRWAARIAAVRYVYEPRTGLSHARNTGVDQATGDVLAFVDDDVLVDRGWLDGLRDAFARWPDAAGAAGRVDLAWPAGRPAWLPEQREVWFARFDLGDEPVPLTADDYPVGANMAVRRDVALDAGGFDPALGYSGSHRFGNEEREFFDRVRRGGGTLIYAPAARVDHVVEGERLSRRYLIRRLYDQGRSDVRAGRRPGDPARAGLVLLRSWRNDVRRLARRTSRDRELVDVLAGRARQLGVVHEAIASWISSTRSRYRPGERPPN